MSLYLFIITMDPLSRWLNHNMQIGRIRGLKISNSAQPMSSSMFADDLLLMGKLSKMEVLEIRNTLTVFSSVSGLKINQQKSKAWFSANSSLEEKGSFMEIFGVQEAMRDEKYLGAPV